MSSVPRVLGASVSLRSAYGRTDAAQRSEERFEVVRVEMQRHRAATERHATVRATLDHELNGTVLVTHQELLSPRARITAGGSAAIGLGGSETPLASLERHP